MMQRGWTFRVQCPFAKNAQVNNTCKKGMKMELWVNSLTEDEREQLIGRMETHIYVVHKDLSNRQDRAWAKQAVEDGVFESWEEEAENTAGPPQRPPPPPVLPPAKPLLMRSAHDRDGDRGGSGVGRGQQDDICPIGGRMRMGYRSRSPLERKPGSSAASSSDVCVIAAVAHYSSATLNELVKAAQAELRRRTAGSRT